MADGAATAVLTWDAMAVGDELGPLRYTITPEVGASFVDASTMSPQAAALLVDASGQAVAHPMATISDYATLMRNRYGAMGTGFHTRHESVFHRPIPLGVEIETRGTVVELFERRGRDYWVIEYQSRAAGELLLEHRMTATIDRAQQAQPAREVGHNAQPSTAATTAKPSRTVPFTDVLAALPARTFTLDTFRAFGRQYRLRFGDTGPAEPNAHTSVEVARAAGLPDAVAYSSHYYCWFAELALTRWGPEWLYGGAASARFLAPAYPGDAVGVRAAAQQGEGVDVLAMQAVDSADNVISVGEARVTAHG